MGPFLLLDLLDPAHESLEKGAPLRVWWELARRFALHPERISESLRASADALACAGAIPPGSSPPVGVAPDPRVARRLAEGGWVAVPIGAEAYPARLRAIADPPLLLWVRGDVAALHETAVGIVGARRCTRYGETVAARLAGGAAQAGAIVVSGLARGIDAAAHRAALRAGRTVAVLAHGPDSLYPAGHRTLADAVSRRGALATEFPPGVTPRKPFFPLRNRIISGLSGAVVVVEARRRSGSLTTARHALAQGREVLAVPGPVDVATSEGTNLLLRDGAAAALDETDVLGALGALAPARPAAEGSEGDPAGASPLLRALGERPHSIDELAAKLGLATETVSREILELELAGRVVRGAHDSVRRT